MKFSAIPKKTRDVGRLIRDPATFAEVMLGHNLWSKQKEILQSLATCPRTAVKACHASGKTRTAADAVLWWITSHPEAIAVTTAPTWTQVERVLWGEIRGAVYNARFAYPKPSATSIHLGPNRYAIGLATNEGVRFQGFHGSVLVVLDEAPGILPEIWEAIEGIRAGGDVRVLALGNIWKALIRGLVSDETVAHPLDHFPTGTRRNSLCRAMVAHKSQANLPLVLFMDGWPTNHSLSEQHISNDLLTREFHHPRRATLLLDGHFPPAARRRSSGGEWSAHRSR